MNGIIYGTPFLIIIIKQHSNVLLFFDLLAHLKTFGDLNRIFLSIFFYLVLFQFLFQFSLLEEASDFYTDLIEGQEYFDILVSMSQNPIGRDVVWNFYRHNYELLVDR